MKKIVLLMFGLLFAGIFSVASANGVISGESNPIIGASISDGGNLIAPSEILEVKATVKEAEIPMYSKNGMESDKLNMNGIAYLGEQGGSNYDIIGKKLEVGWQGYTDA